MLVPTIIMGVLALALLAVGHSVDKSKPVEGAKVALGMVGPIIPLLVFAFIIAGMIQVLLSPELIGRWVGSESGLRGIMLGAVAGGLSPGGPFVSLPIALGLLRAGAGVGTMVAYLTGWSLWAIARLPMEVGILGWKFTAIRFASTLVLPPIAGITAQLLFGSVELQ